MYSIPSSPRTPTSRRKSSFELQPTSVSPNAAVNDYRRSSFNRRNSQHSTESPTIHRLETSQEWPVLNGTSSATEYGDPTGLGNLADELADALDQDEEGAQSEFSEQPRTHEDDSGKNNSNGYSDSNYGVNISSPNPTAMFEKSPGPPKQSARTKHRRVNTQYDGSDYGDDSDFEAPDDIVPSLESRLAVVEGLALQGGEATGCDPDNPVKRFADSLKELPSQSRVEDGVTRLITSYSSLSTHLANQSRLVLNLSHPLTSPLSIPPDQSTIDELLELLADLVLSLPTPTLQCLSSLHSLHTSSRDLQSTLTQLTDTIYMTRQTSTQASRKLKTTSDMVSEMRKDAEAREQDIKWKGKSRCNSSLDGRERAKICREVNGGYQEACDGWRARIKGGDVEIGVA